MIALLPIHGVIAMASKCTSFMVAILNTCVTWTLLVCVYRPYQTAVCDFTIGAVMNTSRLLVWRQELNECQDLEAILLV